MTTQIHHGRSRSPTKSVSSSSSRGSDSTWDMPQHISSCVMAEEYPALRKFCNLAIASTAANNYNMGTIGTNISGINSNNSNNNNNYNLLGLETISLSPSESDSHENQLRDASSRRADDHSGSRRYKKSL